MAWTLRITDTVPMAHRKEYVETLKEALKMAPKDPKHIGSWRVAYGHALEFMHLWELENIVDFGEVEWPMDFILEYRKVHHLYTDTYWEWLIPVEQ